MGRFLKIGGIFLFFCILAFVRFSEEHLFYDPLLTYFKGGYLEDEQLPFVDLWKHFVSITFRFWLNTAISLIILYIAFGESSVVKFALLFYIFTYTLLISAYFYFLEHYVLKDYLTLYYVRRFLIQPLFVILLLPAFYYQSQMKK
ncbi:MAG: exosortase F system-associated protein [Leeuwenhoekiella sp.]